ncbi:MAG: HEAT repeat domain-containing protein [Theionarchaea archaeon]|nr:HEAT repeat domain-containing protein [Theionarchaea archaeon]MBU7000145.1 HEAT repeat domain-containing protein [Theionarchaea archaeon]MBU7020862.1 HEAT repeat domain-containing protein [Theionarchaea archaeon]MBU7033902.1 HEAT repeat domain-containing protein [Theionarchaea archaeon]MBU7039197.1 HEAT repeat domain-containing protein [Theionarchaea archaeon]
MRAKRSIDKMEKKKDVAGLIEMLRRNDWTLRRKAATALEKVGAPAVEAVIIALEDENRYVRRMAALILGTIRDRRAVEPLIAVLGDQDTNVRRCAAESLGKLKDKRAIEPLVLALREEKDSVRWIIALALQKLGGEKEVDSLMGALEDSQDVRENEVEGNTDNIL